MIRRYLEGYDKFKCIADKCPDTCCSGWLIEIDDESLLKYKELSAKDNEFGNRIDFNNQCFKQEDNRDCAFLCKDGFCYMQREYGEKTLCYTCDMYPRHVEEFPQTREYSLSVSCPVVAKTLIQKKSYIKFSDSEDLEKDDEEYEEFNELLYSNLLELRTVIVKLLSENSAKYEIKAQRIINSMQAVQEAIDEGIWVSLVGEFEKCNKGVTENSFEEYLSEFELIENLEPLRREFSAWMKQSLNKLKSETDVEKHYSIFDKEHPEMDMIQCNVTLYFIYTYFCGAVYDDYVYSMARLSIFAGRMIKLLCFAKWLECGKIEVDEILYKLCRELEHSADNISIIKQELDLM